MRDPEVGDRSPLWAGLAFPCRGSRSEPAGIDCPDTCSFDFPEGTEVTLTPAPAASSDLAAWSGDCTGLAAGCTLTMDAGHAVEARFGLHGSSGRRTSATSTPTTTPSPSASRPSRKAAGWRPAASRATACSPRAAPRSPRMSTGTAPSHEWAVALGGDDTDRAEGLAVDADGYVYVLAYFNGMTTVDGQTMTAMAYDAWLGALVR